MFEDLLEKLPLQMENQQRKAQAQMMGSIHFQVTKKIKDQELELQWNVYYGQEITPELVKKELKEWGGIIKKSKETVGGNK